MHIDDLQSRAGVWARRGSIAAVLLVPSLCVLGLMVPWTLGLWVPRPVLEDPAGWPSLGFGGLAIAALVAAMRAKSRVVAAALYSALAAGALVTAAASGAGHAGVLLFAATAGVLAASWWTQRPETTWFRESPKRAFWVLALRTVGQAVLFTGVFLGIGGWLVLQVESSAQVPRFHQATWLWTVALAVGCVLQSLQLGSALWMAKEGDGTPLPIEMAAHLVVSGPYAYVRNPIALFGISQGVLAGLALGSVALTAYSVAGGVAWHVFVRPIEEHDLTRRFGESYRRYQREVPLWWPRWTPFNTD